MLDVKGLFLAVRNLRLELFNLGFKLRLFIVVLLHKLFVLPFGEQAGHKVFIQTTHKPGKLVVSFLHTL